MSCLRAHLFAVLLIPLVGACGTPSADPLYGKTYRASDLELIANFTAKEACTCLWVLAKDESFCRDHTKQSPPVASWIAHRNDKRVTASAAISFTGQARWVSESEGCVLDP